MKCTQGILEMGKHTSCKVIMGRLAHDPKKADGYTAIDLIYLKATGRKVLLPMRVIREDQQTIAATLKAGDFVCVDTASDTLEVLRITTLKK